MLMSASDNSLATTKWASIDLATTYWLYTFCFCGEISDGLHGGTACRSYDGARMMRMVIKAFVTVTYGTHSIAYRLRQLEKLGMGSEHVRKTRQLNTTHSRITLHL